MLAMDNAESFLLSCLLLRSVKFLSTSNEAILMIIVSKLPLIVNSVWAVRMLWAQDEHLAGVS